MDKIVLEMKGKMLDTRNNVIAVEFGGSGISFRSLAKGIDVKSTLRGQMLVQGTEIEIKGGFVVDEMTTRRR